jgi:hypothetical protein
MESPFQNTYTYQEVDHSITVNYHANPLLTDENIEAFIQHIVATHQPIHRVVFHQQDFTHLPSNIGLLQDLQHFEIYGVPLQQLPLQLFTIQPLHYLSIMSTDLTQIPSQIGQLQNLEHLILNDNFIESYPMEITQIPTLQELSSLNNPGVITQSPIYPILQERGVNVRLDQEYDDDYVSNDGADDDVSVIDANDIINDDFDGVIEEDHPEQDQHIIPGIAFEVHNAFNHIFKTVPIQHYEQQLIDLVGHYNLDVPMMNPPFEIENEQDRFGLGVYNCMAHMIENLYNGDQDKNMLKQKYDELFEMTYYSGIFESLFETILVTLIFIIKINYQPLINLYVETYIKDCTNAYQGDHPMSCVKGIIERYILNFKQSVEVLCCFSEEPCGVQDLQTMCTLFKLMNISDNARLNEVIQEWTAQVDEVAYNTLTPEQRKNSLIQYLVQVYTKDVTVEELIPVIREKLVEKLQQPPFNLINYECKDKLETVIEPDDCDKGVDAVGAVAEPEPEPEQNGGRHRKKLHKATHKRKNNRKHKPNRTHRIICRNKQSTSCKNKNIKKHFRKTRKSR